jgi:hypothetical protein
MMRVDRRYGERPEIFSNVGWRVLTELASSVTSEAERQKFEALILAGERVNGAEIIRARATIAVRTPRTASARCASDDQAHGLRRRERYRNRRTSGRRQELGDNRSPHSRSSDHEQKNEKPEARKTDGDRGRKVFGTRCNFHCRHLRWCPTMGGTNRSFRDKMMKFNCQIDNCEPSGCSRSCDSLMCWTNIEGA